MNKKKWVVFSRRRWSELLPALSAVFLLFGVTDQAGIDLIDKAVVAGLNAAGALLGLWTHLRPDGATLSISPGS